MCIRVYTLHICTYVCTYTRTYVCTYVHNTYNTHINNISMCVRARFQLSYHSMCAIRLLQYDKVTTAYDKIIYIIVPVLSKLLSVAKLELPCSLKKWHRVCYNIVCV